jgi:hypothetical protein
MTEVVREAIILAWSRISAFCTPKQQRGQSIVQAGLQAETNLIHTWLQPGGTGISLILEPFQRFTNETIEMVILIS